MSYRDLSDLQLVAEWPEHPTHTLSAKVLPEDLKAKCLVQLMNLHCHQTQLLLGLQPLADKPLHLSKVLQPPPNSTSR